MNRRLTITIDANRVTCGKCEHAFYLNLSDRPKESVHCQLFDVYTVGRCAPCLAAESAT